MDSIKIAEVSVDEGLRYSADMPLSKQFLNIHIRVVKADAVGRTLEVTCENRLSVGDLAQALLLLVDNALPKLQEKLAEGMKYVDEHKYDKND